MKKFRVFALLSGVFAFVPCLLSGGVYDDQASWRAALPNPGLLETPAFRFVKENPKLPNVLIIGDSISIGYTPEVRSLLAGKFNVFRVPANGGNTTGTLERLDAWLAGKQWTVIHCNWGLHDLTSKGPALEGYGKNLETLVDKLRATGAVVVFATTTPIAPDNMGRLPEAELPYNQKALEVMAAKKILVNDLYGAALPHLEQWQRPADVHFSEFGSAMLAQKVARAILNAHRGGEFAKYLETGAAK